MPAGTSSYSMKQHCADFNRAALVGVKNLIPCVWDSLMLIQLSPLCLGKVLLLSPLLSLRPRDPTNALFIPFLFLKAIHAHVVSCVCSWVSLLVRALMPWAWRQWKYSSTGFAAALCNPYAKGKAPKDFPQKIHQKTANGYM